MKFRPVGTCIVIGLSFRFCFRLRQSGFHQEPIKRKRRSRKRSRKKWKRSDSAGYLPFTKIFREIRLESKWITTFGSYQRKISGSNGTSEKVVLFSRMEYSKRKFVLHFFKAIFDTSFRPSRRFPMNGTDL